jgi:hypothetical protein
MPDSGTHLGSAPTSYASTALPTSKISLRFNHNLNDERVAWVDVDTLIIITYHSHPKKKNK